MFPTLLLLAVPAPATQSPSLHVRVDAPVPTTIFEQRLAAEGFDVLTRSDTKKATPPWFVELVVQPAERAALEARGLEVEVIAKGRPLRDILEEQSLTDGIRSKRTSTRSVR